MPIIKLQSSDGEIFETDLETAKCSSTIRTLIDDCGLESEDNPLIPLPNVNSTILNKVLTWAKHHKGDLPTTEESGGAEAAAIPPVTISAWDADFLTMDQGTLFELILAANYLDIRQLLNVSCMTVANMIKGHTAAEIRELFHIPNDFSASEEDLLRGEKESEVAADAQSSYPEL